MKEKWRAPRRRRDGSIMKVLVVDDNKNLADLIQEVLEHGDIRVTAAYDSIAGYAAYLSFKPDLVITDIQMPGGTGFEMMQHIRVHNPMIRTVYISGNIETHRPTVEWEKKHYPVTFLPKPFPLKSLTALVLEQKQSVPMEDDNLLYRESGWPPADGLLLSQ
jgi:CheY-like chemotaxis protein